MRHLIAVVRIAAAPGECYLGLRSDSGFLLLAGAAFEIVSFKRLRKLSAT